MSDAHKNAKDVRLTKLEAALKENLRRRKAQRRARKTLGKEDTLKRATKGSVLSPDLAKEPD
jgi:hypothetical protein